MRSFVMFAVHQIFMDEEIKGDKLSEECKGMKEIRNKYRISVGKLEGRRPHGRDYRKLEESTKIDGKEVWCECMK
jgi:hypothetical protein